MSIIINRVLAGDHDFAGKAPPSRTDLADLTVSELRAICADEGLAVSKRAKKAELIAAIGAHRGR